MYFEMFTQMKIPFAQTVCDTAKLGVSRLTLTQTPPK